MYRLTNRPLARAHRITLSLLALVTACISSSRCVPVEPGKDRLAGKWAVEWTCGTERLELKPEGSYVQEIAYAGGGRASHSGTWRVTPKTSRLEGAHVVLQAADDYCTAFGEKLPTPERGDRQLETIWEWGRVILSFNPDIPGFERQ
jgi:hypothetical protein